MTTGRSSVNNMTSAAPLLSEAEIHDLLVLPVLAAAVATAPQVSTVIQTTSSRYRLPVLSENPSAAWTFEGSEIGISDAKFGEVIVEPMKLSALTIASSEMIDDADDDAIAIIGGALVNDTAVKLNQAFLGNLSAPAARGLGALAGAQTVSAGQNLSSLDPFVDAAAMVATVGATVSAWIMSPQDAVTVAKLKTANGSAVPLLAPAGDPSQPARRVIEGAPVFVSAAATPGTIVGIDGSRVFTVVRSDASVVADRSVYFTSDRVGIRSTMRVAFGFPHEAAVVKIVLGGSSASGTPTSSSSTGSTGTSSTSTGGPGSSES